MVNFIRRHCLHIATKYGSISCRRWGKKFWSGWTGWLNCYCTNIVWITTSGLFWCHSVLCNASAMDRTRTMMRHWTWDRGDMCRRTIWSSVWGVLLMDRFVFSFCLFSPYHNCRTLMCRELYCDNCTTTVTGKAPFQPQCWVIVYVLNQYDPPVHMGSVLGNLRVNLIKTTFAHCRWHYG